MSDSNPSQRPPLSLFTLSPVNRGTLYRISTLLWLAGIALLCVPMVTLIDVPIARWFGEDPLPREFSEALDLMRLFSHGWGIFMVLTAILTLFPQKRWYVPRLITLALGAGAVSTLTKMFVLRPRPNVLNLEIASYDSAWLWAFDWNLEQVAAFEANTRAFPSSNMATAIALTAGLWVVLPRGRFLFVMVCAGTLVQRLSCGSHFLSDLFGGAAFGLLWSYTCLHPSLLGSVFDKMEPETPPSSIAIQPTAEPPEQRIAA
jgi:membrane-associated phospholipid phosphatase